MSATISGFGRGERLRSTSSSLTMDALGVLVEFGAPGAPADADHLGHIEQQALGDGADPVDSDSECRD